MEKTETAKTSTQTLYRVDAISPVDGRYRKQTEPLAAMFSERGLMKHRLIVEGEYLISLYENGLGKRAGKTPAFVEFGPRWQDANGVNRKLGDDEIKFIRSLYALEQSDAQIIKDIEVRGHGGIKATNHDVKAVEYYMQLKVKGTSLEDTTSMIHFGLTSEDTNNLAYALMIKRGVNEVLLPTIHGIMDGLAKFALDNKDLPILARTHGQPASPTTFGKEFAVFHSRLAREVKDLESFTLLTKLNGATGNYNAHRIAYPEVDWVGFTKKFIDELDAYSSPVQKGIRLGVNLVTTQIEPHDTYARLFDNLKRINNILIDLDQDIWRYVSDGWIKQRPVEGEVGSSTMPHKVNPIDFENSETRLGLANALFEFFSRKLPISRLQRDLSDSTVEREFGTALANSLIGYNSILKGFGKISVDKEKVAQALAENPEVLTEAIQTVLRKEGVPNAYEKLKQISRGRKMTLDDINTFVSETGLPQEAKERLKGLTPERYIGLAVELTEASIKQQ
jgi:adenylosuccinate lyase